MATTKEMMQKMNNKPNTTSTDIANVEASTLSALAETLQHLREAVPRTQKVLKVAANRAGQTVAALGTQRKANISDVDATKSGSTAGPGANA